MSPLDTRAAPALSKATALSLGPPAAPLIPRPQALSYPETRRLLRDTPGKPGTSSQAARTPWGLKPQRDALSLGLDPGGGPKVVRGSAPGSVLLLAVLGVDHGSPRCRHIPVSRASSQGVCP